MKLYHRADWGARKPSSFPGTRAATEWGTVHWSGDHITDAGIRAGFQEPTSIKPKKPGPKWYRKWRDSLTPRIQRANISRQIRKYNAAVREWHKTTVPLPLDHAIFENEKRIMRSFQNYHMDGHGWSDIGYHYVIFATGNVYEARTFSYRGAHAYGANHTTGICFVMGPGDEPTPQMLAAFEELKRFVGVTKYKGHNQWAGNATQCPGPALKSILHLPVE